MRDGALRVIPGGDALQAILDGNPAETAPRRIGAADAVPKVVVRRLLAGCARAGIRLPCRERASDHLEREVVARRLDILVSDREPANIRGEDLESAIAGRSGIVPCARPETAIEAEDGAPLHHLAQSGPCAVPVAKSTAATVERPFGLARVGEPDGGHETGYEVRTRGRVPVLGARR